MVIDHTSYAVSDTEGDHTLIASDDFIQSDVILGSTTVEVSCVTRLFVDCNVCWEIVCMYLITLPQEALPPTLMANRSLLLAENLASCITSS